MLENPTNFNPKAPEFLPGRGLYFGATKIVGTMQNPFVKHKLPVPSQLVTLCYQAIQSIEAKLLKFKAKANVCLATEELQAITLRKVKPQATQETHQACAKYWSQCQIGLKHVASAYFTICKLLITDQLDKYDAATSFRELHTIATETLFHAADQAYSLGRTAAGLAEHEDKAFISFIRALGHMRAIDSYISKGQALPIHLGIKMKDKLLIDVSLKLGFSLYSKNKDGLNCFEFAHKIGASHLVADLEQTLTTQESVRPRASLA